LVTSLSRDFGIKIFRRCLVTSPFNDFGTGIFRRGLVISLSRERFWNLEFLRRFGNFPLYGYLDWNFSFFKLLFPLIILFSIFSLTLFSSLFLITFFVSFN